MQSCWSGPGRPSIRQTAPAKSWDSAYPNPARLRASKPDDGLPDAQAILTPPPSAVKSTTTVTPAVPEQAPPAATAGTAVA